MRRQLGLADDAVVIGCVARLTRWKGQATLLDALPGLLESAPSVRLVLAGLPSDSAPDGNGDYRDFLIRRIAQRGLERKVVLPGFLPQSDMPRFYGALDVLAHPSFEEPFGLAVVEAMASELPVVAVDGGGIPEIIRHEREGLLVRADNPPAVTAAILRLLRDPGYAQELARAGRQRVLDAFTPEAQATAMLHVYHQVLEQRAARQANVATRRAQKQSRNEPTAAGPL
jgi:glycosyltransferase involved in cell wall biosynthesis